MIKKDSFNEYKKAEGINASALKEYFNGGWLHLEICRKIADKRPEKKAFDFGRACHEFILEPEEFEKNFVVKPDNLSFATKAGKEWKAENEDKEILDSSDYEKMEYAKAYWDCHGISVCEDLQVESSAYIDFQDLKLKARFDVLSKNNGFICDLKSTKDSSIKEFQKSIVDYKYWVQAGFYALVYRELFSHIPDFYFFAIPKSGNPPFLCKISNNDLMQFIRKVEGSLFEYSLQAESEVMEIEFNKWQREKMEI